MTEKLYWNEEIETASRKELESYQTRQLAEHLEFTYNHSVYYKDSFDAAGVKPADLKNFGDIRKFPFINKQTERDRQIARPLLGDMNVHSPSLSVGLMSSGHRTWEPFVYGPALFPQTGCCLFCRNSSPQ